MDKIRLELINCEQVTYIPIAAENEVVELVIDMTEAFRAYPDGRGEMWFKRADGEIYLFEQSVCENGIISAVITDVETEISGIASVEGWWISGTHLKKSPTYRLGVHQSFTVPANLREIKARAQTVLEQCEALQEEYEETRDACYEARDQALAARDESMELAERVQGLHDDAETLLAETMETVSAKTTQMDGYLGRAETAATQAQRSAVTAQTERESATAYAAAARESAESITGSVSQARDWAQAAKLYSEQAMAEHNAAETAMTTAQTYQNGAVAAKTAAETAQTAAERARDLTNGYMNTAAENSQQAEEAAARAESAARVAPSISVTDITGGHRVTITDADGEHSFDVMDGQGAGAVQDVAIGSTSGSVVQDGIAVIPVAAVGRMGVVSGQPGGGVTVVNGGLRTAPADQNDVKDGNHFYKPITPNTQHRAVFYGLAKAAGYNYDGIADDGVGHYSGEGLAAIQTMLGVSGIVGTVETGKASKTYAVGKAFLYNGKLYKATDVIAEGSAIVPGTNCEETTLLDLL